MKKKHILTIILLIVLTLSFKSKVYADTCYFVDDVSKANTFVIASGSSFKMKTSKKGKYIEGGRFPTNAQNDWDSMASKYWKKMPFMQTRVYNACDYGMLGIIEFKDHNTTKLDGYVMSSDDGKQKWNDSETWSSWDCSTGCDGAECTFKSKKIVYHVLKTQYDKLLEEPKPSSSSQPPSAPSSTLNCRNLIDTDVKLIINDILNYFRVLVPIIIIGFSTYEFSKATASTEDEMKKAQTRFIKRLVIGVALFLTPVFVNIILNIAEVVWENSDLSTCTINGNQAGSTPYELKFSCGTGYDCNLEKTIITQDSAIFYIPNWEPTLENCTFKGWYAILKNGNKQGVYCKQGSSLCKYHVFTIKDGKQATLEAKWDC